MLPGDGSETRNEYTMRICGTDPDLYQLSNYLYDDYDVDGDHHLDKHDYEAFHLKMDSNGKPFTRIFTQNCVLGKLG
ncbi:hypothetical protein DPMN_147649 [Dreissena polymorpha]|uniref:EF-hand domain-containing protein n=1 Tax=Dreissena polymorpha TaxID=45954 RepID=A0A9D4J368_DREPO|nr:hypothetical protein DPMN_147649 [Dreissena polymorpha]